MSVTVCVSNNSKFSERVLQNEGKQAKKKGSWFFALHHPTVYVCVLSAFFGQRVAVDPSMTPKMNSKLVVV